jgi:hypothetical protein
VRLLGLSVGAGTSAKKDSAIRAASNMRVEARIEQPITVAL